MTATGFAQDQFNSQHVDTSALEFSFQRADRENDAERWLAEVQNGLTAVRAAWEIDALAWYADPAELASARQGLSTWLDEAVGARYSRWLNERFFGNEAARLRQLMQEQVGEANRQYLYQTDADGNILYDAAGDAMFIRPDQNANLESDRAEWRTMINDGAVSLVDNFMAFVQTKAAALLSYLTGSNDTRFNDLLAGLKQTAGERLQRELDVVARQEERLFIARRTNDIWSLRRQSEGETADVIATELANQTSYTCDQALLALQTRIEAAQDGGGDLALAGEEWLQQFQAQFERGLSIWEETEEKFIARRMQWEVQSGDLWSEGNKAWATALQKISQARDSWQQKALALIQTGETAFEQASAELSARITAAKTEMQRDGEERAEAFANRAAAWVEVYTQSASMMLSAKDSLRYWLTQAGVVAMDISQDAAGFEQAACTTLLALLSTERDRLEGESGWRQSRAAVDARQAEYDTSSASLTSLQETKTGLLQEQADLQAEYDTLNAIEQSNLTDEQRERLEELPAELENRETALAALETEIEQAVAIKGEAEAALLAAKKQFEAANPVWMFLEEKLAKTYNNLAEFLPVIKELTERPEYALRRNGFEAMFEAVKWQAIYKTYEQHAIEARTKLIQEFDLLLGAEGSGAPLLVDVLNPTASSEDFFLDEYQLELLRVRSVENYWTKRLAIATAVYEYATDQSAGRETEADTARLWAESKTAYDEALSQYQLAAAQLTALGAAIGSSQEAITAARQALTAAGTQLETLNRQYADLVAVMLLNSNEFLRQAVEDRYCDLLALHGLGPRADAEATTESELMATYLAAAAAYHHDQFVATAAGQLQGLIQGDDNQPSLKALSDQQTLLAGFLAEKEPTDIALLLTQYDTLKEAAPYQSIQACLSAYDAEFQVISNRVFTGSDAAAQKEAALEELSSRYQRLIHLTLGKALAQATTSLESRQAGLKLLCATDAGAWYEAVTANELMAGLSVAASLTAEAEGYQAQLLRERVGLALEAFTKLANPASAEPLSANGQWLTTLWRGTADSAQAWLTTLQQITEILAQELSLAATGTELEALAAGNSQVRQFLLGNTPFIVAGQDVLGLLTAETATRLEATRNRQFVVAMYGSYSAALNDERYAASMAVLQSCLNEVTNSPDSTELPAIKTIGDSLVVAGNDWQAGLQRINQAVAEAAQAAPEFVARQLGQWQQGLNQYVMAKAWQANVDSPTDIASLTNSLEANQTTLSQLQDLLNTLQGDNQYELITSLYQLTQPNNLGLSASVQAVLGDLLVEKLSAGLFAGYIKPDFNAGQPNWANVQVDLEALLHSQYGLNYSAADTHLALAVENVVRKVQLDYALDTSQKPEDVINQENRLVVLGGYMELLAPDYYNQYLGRLPLADLVALDILPGILNTIVGRLAADATAADFKAALSALVTLDAEGNYTSDFLTLLDGQSPAGLAMTAAWLQGAIDDWPTDAILTEHVAALRAKAAADFESTLAIGKSAMDEIRAEFEQTGAFAAYMESGLALRLANLGLTADLTQQVLEAFLPAQATLGMAQFGNANVGELIRASLTANASHEFKQDLLYLLYEPLIFAATDSQLNALTAEAQASGLDITRFSATLEQRRQLSLSQLYIGELSGERGAWAMARNADDAQQAVAILRLLDGGASAGGPADPILQVLTQSLVARAEALFQTANRQHGLLGVARTWQEWSQRETANEAADLKHWREYLVADIITGTDLVSGLATDLESADALRTRVADRRAGLLTDAWQYQERLQGQLQLALERWSNLSEDWQKGNPDPVNQVAAGFHYQRYGDFATLVQAWLDDPTKVFVASDLPETNYTLEEAFQAVGARLQTIEQQRQRLMAEIASRGASYELSQDRTAIVQQLAILKQTIQDQQTQYDEKLALYQTAATGFASAGADYDAQYDVVKTSWDSLETARTAYETRDAIKRWAATAYLAAANTDASATVPDASAPGAWRTPSDELDFCRLMQTRANLATAALTNLNATVTQLEYNDPDYNRLYLAYQQNYQEKLLAAKAQTALSAAVAEAERRNTQAYTAWHDQLYKNGVEFLKTKRIDEYTGTDFETANFGPNSINNYLYIKDGRLRINFNGGDLKAINATTSQDLAAHFALDKTITGQSQTSSTYEQELSAWNQRIAGWLTDKTKFQRLALARAYLIGQFQKGIPGTASEAEKTNLEAFNNMLGGVDSNPLADSLGKQLLYNALGLQIHLFDGVASQLSTAVTEYHNTTLKTEMEKAWNDLSEEERADLEMLLFSMENGKNGNLKAVFQKSLIEKEFEFAKQRLQESQRQLSIGHGLSTGRMLLYFGLTFLNPVMGWLYAAEFINNAYIMYKMSETSAAIQLLNNNYISADSADNPTRFNNSFSQNARNTAAFQGTNVKTNLDAYTATTATLAKLKGSGATSTAEVSLATLQTAMATTGALSAEEMTDLGTLYQRFRQPDGDTGPVNEQVKAGDATTLISRMLNWSRNQTDKSQQALEEHFASQAGDQQTAAAAYQTVYNQYLLGEATDEQLAAAAAKAFGPASASYRTHLRRLGNHYQTYLFTETPSLESEALGDISSYQTLIHRIANARNNAELQARQYEWRILQTDLEHKTAAWQDAASLILERGLTDFDAGYSRLQEGWQAWQNRYQAEYDRYAFLWSDSWLTLQTDKMGWVEQATLAANTAASDVHLALLGDAAASAGRAAELDIIPELQLENSSANLLEEALNATGITSLSSALSAQSGSANTAASSVRTGLGGPSAWDAATIQVAASSFVRSANQELAARQARIMAAQAREQLAQIIGSIDSAVAGANQNFSDSMDATWQGDGYWNISGGYYTKEVVVHSTVQEKYITQAASVRRYNPFAPAPVEIQTDLSESNLQTLDADAIQALMLAVQDEVEAAQEVLFGKKDEKSVSTLIRSTYEKPVLVDGIPETRYDEEGNEYTYTPRVWTTETTALEADQKASQTISPGLFGNYIGAAPIVKLQPNLDEGQDGIFEAASLGKGELGRLMAEYIYWSMQEGRGYTEANKPVYDKALWDSRGSWFQAPTIKGLVDIGVTIAATALTAPLGGIGGALLGAGVGLVDDAIFGLLDGTSGYKKWEEVGLDFGKKVASAAVNLAIGGVFNGFAAAPGSDAVGKLFGKVEGLASSLPTSGIGSVIGKTMLGGMQTMTTSLANSAINAFQWDGQGISWSGDAFGQGVQGGLISMASGMASTFVGGSLGLANLYDGNAVSLSSNIFNTQNISAFNGLMGGLAGAGVTYALTGNATFNVLNASDLTGGALSGGLFELSFGKNGFSGGQIGMGGTNVSLGTIASSLGGLMESINIARMKYGDAGQRQIFNGINMLGYTGNEANWDLGKRIFGGRQGVDFVELSGGLATTEGGRIQLDTRLMGEGLESAAQLAAFMAHEDDHLSGLGEGDAYIREFSSFADLQSAFNITGEGLISGIGEMASYYTAHGRDATLGRLDNQGLLAAVAGRNFARRTLSAEQEAWVTERYGSDVANKIKIMGSESVRELYASGGAIRDGELSDFAGGESARLGMEAGFRSQALQALAQTRGVAEAFLAESALLDRQYTALLREAGIDRRQLTGGLLPALQQATGAALRAMMPAYLTYAAGEGLGYAADSLGLPLGPGGLPVSVGSDFSLELTQPDEYLLDMMWDGAAEIGSRLVGGQVTANQIAGVIGIFRADYEAAIAGFSLAGKVWSACDESDASVRAEEAAGQTWGMMQDYQARRLAEEMGSFQAAADFFQNNVGNLDAGLRSWLTFQRGRSPMGASATSVNALIERDGYSGGFTSGNPMLRQIFNLTAHDSHVYERFETTVDQGNLWRNNSFEMHGYTTTNINFSNEIYYPYVGLSNRFQHSLRSWTWRNGTLRY
ncbi:MAG: hypothetical protein A2Y37_07140 [Spirochaetes bacterium GWB1_60_80]|nr:MAG: hypothetical protein A2Y37_07140 [Spirochaetes bacterium GWB1_60_80]OHD43650.1 MAG: hypothetical protein A2Y35_06335 [Spirochaetes bacterium GWE1_60_18]OHD59155.1 MAG: hypothetical protein A2Y32_14825 [Spirochaetes bacterium GWF1_60_12]